MLGNHLLLSYNDNCVIVNSVQINDSKKMERFCFTYVKSYIIEEQFSVFNISLFILRYITYFTLFLHLPFLTFIDAAEPLLCSQSRLVTSCHWIDVFLV